MKLNILYTLDSKGKIRVFECEVNNEAYDNRESDNILIYTRTGLLNGKLIQKTESVSNGKQNRSPLEQAEFQAKSLWNEKLDEGYKGLTHIEAIYRQMSNPYELDTEFIKDAIKEFPNLFNTNLNGDELPMLAHKFKDIKETNFPYYAQPKLNGVRCLVKYEGWTKDGTTLPTPHIKLCSRGGKYYHIPHLEHNLAILFETFKTLNINPKSIILDGEIYKHGIPLQDISGAARKEDNSMFASNNWLEYHIYDMINLEHLEYPQFGRIGALQSLAKIFDSSMIKFVETTAVGSLSGVKSVHDRYISEGYEGLILREMDGKYEFNTRSKNLLKVKEYKDAEFKILDWTCNSNKELGESFCFILKNDINDLTFEARPTGTVAMKERWAKNTSSWINKKATVRYFERSKDGLPLQGCVRHQDTQCLIEHLRPTDE